MKSLLNLKKFKQYDVYAYLLDERHKTVFLKDMEEMGFLNQVLMD